MSPDVQIVQAGGDASGEMQIGGAVPLVHRAVWLGVWRAPGIVAPPSVVERDEPPATAVGKAAVELVVDEPAPQAVAHPVARPVAASKPSVVKSAVKPADKPVQKPLDKSSDKAADKPVSKPPVKEPVRDTSKDKAKDTSKTALQGVNPLRGAVWGLCRRQRPTKPA